MKQNIDKLLNRVTACYQPIVELETGAVAGFEMLARISDGDGAVRSIGPMIGQIESDPVLLERLMRKLLGTIKQTMVISNSGTSNDISAIAHISVAGLARGPEGRHGRVLMRRNSITIVLCDHIGDLKTWISSKVHRY
jgi:EAL domain-containing protein (putative c-di-GMP-specific phosphodiesterase class I)